MKKDWYKSRTMWIALIGAVMALLNATGYPIPTWVVGLLGSAGLYTARVAGN